MEIHEKIIWRLLKVYKLSIHGVGGEKENAARILQAKLSKYGLTIEQLCQNEKKQQRSFKKYNFKTAFEKQLLIQCACKIANSKGVKAYPDKKKLAISLTDLEHLELEAFYSYHLELFRKELKAFQEAFIYKHDIFPVDQVPGDPRELSPKARENLERVCSIIGSLSESNYVSTRKRLTG